jgi:hypothetical protein
VPQRPSFRRDLESQKFVLEQELFRLYGPEYAELQWARETLTRLESTRGDIGTSDQDRADLEKVRLVLD